MSTQESASEKAAETARTKADQVREKAEGAADEAKRLAEEIGNRATDYASEAIGGAREAVDEKLRDEQQRTEGFLYSLSDAIDAGCERLREDGYRGTASMVRPASRAVRSVANDINGINPQDYTRRAEEFVRENPMVAMGMLALAGFTVAALLQRNR